MQVQFTIYCSPFPCLIFLQLIISWELWYNQDFLSPHYHSLLQVTLYGPFSVINMTIKRNPFLAGATLISPLVLLSALPPSSLLLPADDGSKLDIQINSMLAYAVYMMILSDYIPPFFNEQSPQLGELIVAYHLFASLIYYRYFMVMIVFLWKESQVHLLSHLLNICDSIDWLLNW